MKIIDTHSHLWLKQDTSWNGLPIRSLKNGRSIFLGEEVQMIPPFIIDGVNSAEVFLSNMDYAQVSGCVVTQEYIDGNQDDYLLQCRRQFPERMRVCCLYEEAPLEDRRVADFDGIKICAGRLADQDLLQHRAVFAQADRLGKFISIDLADGDLQTDAMQHLAEEFPSLLIAIGHFGMVTTPGWQKQIALAKNPKLLLCDEPTGALDYNTGKQILKLLQDTSRETGMTVIVITHNSALMPIADKIIKINDGKIEKIFLNQAPVPVEQIEW